MAYRFNGTTDYMQFGIGPLSGYTPGAITWAAFLKRTTVVASETFIFTETAGGTLRMNLADGGGSGVLQFRRGGSAASTSTITSTTVWYLLVVTVAAGTSTPRFHIWDGANWVHQAGSTTVTDAPVVGGTDKLYVSSPYGAATAPAMDIVCCGIKKSDSTDLQAESLNTIAFSSWRDFGFDWLVGFDGTSARQNVASPGSGDEIARVGTVYVGDPMFGPLIVGTQTVNYETGDADGTSTRLGWYPPNDSLDANFAAAPVSGSTPLTVVFTDTSST